MNGYDALYQQLQIITMNFSTIIRKYNIKERAMNPITTTWATCQIPPVQCTYIYRFRYSTTLHYTYMTCSSLVPRLSARHAPTMNWLWQHFHGIGNHEQLIVTIIIYNKFQTVGAILFNHNRWTSYDNTLNKIWQYFYGIGNHEQ